MNGIVRMLVLPTMLLISLAAAGFAERPADFVKKDLAKLQGKWESKIRTKIGVIRTVQTIAGTTSIVDRYDDKNNLVQSHTAQFKLSATDEVRIFTFFDLEVTAGPRKGLKYKGPHSFVYVVKKDSWIEARGLLIDQKDGEPRLTVWKRIPQKVANIGGTLEVQSTANR